MFFLKGLKLFEILNEKNLEKKIQNNMINIKHSYVFRNKKSSREISYLVKIILQVDSRTINFLANSDEENLVWQKKE